ncbi:ABC transporter permease [Clostridium hydrogenum]|uniref:ABC transporter permease n=1 Tax=Clostridium hydrogenum TaxID=2855764 RepID=UPI001F348BCC|nr:ABC transporter permease [Clostridium hydrogenum]
MNIFINSLKRLVKNKVQIAMLLIVPFIAIIPAIILNSGSNAKILNLGIVDSDNTKFSRIFIQNMKGNLDITKINKIDIKNDINNSKFDYVLIIPHNYTYDIMNLKSKKIIGYEKKNSDCAGVMGVIINSFIYPAKSIAKISHGNSTVFYEGIKKIPKVKLTNKFSKSDNIVVVIWGLVIQFVMFSSIFTSTIILTDKKKKTLYRSLNAPISLKSYMFQTILSFIFISIIQILVLTLVIVYGFGIYSGKSIFNMLGLLILMSFVSVSFGIAVSSICKDETKAVISGIGVVTVMTMLSGCWGMTPSSDIIKNISKALPTTWAMEAVKKILNNDNFNSIGKEAAILLAFAAVFFLLGTWRKSDFEE